MQHPQVTQFSPSHFAIGAMIGATVGGIGSFLPWASALGISVSGLDVGDGKYTLALSVAAGVLGVFLRAGRPLPGVGVLLLGGAVAGIAIYDIVDFNHAIANNPFAAALVKLEAGIYLTAVGGIIAGIAGLASLFSSPGVAVLPSPYAPRVAAPVVDRTYKPSPQDHTAAGRAISSAPAVRAGYLVVQSGLSAGQSFQLNPQTTIGRNAARNDFVLPDPLVSREHAIIRLENDRYVYLDRGAANRSFLVTPNGRQEITKHVLMNGDELLLGDTRLVYREQ